MTHNHWSHEASDSFGHNERPGRGSGLRHYEDHQQENGYTPVNVVPLSSQKTALAQRSNYLFVAVREWIYVYSPTWPQQRVATKPSLVLNGLSENVGLRSRGYIPPLIPHSINNLLVGDLGDEEVLVSADDDGYVCMWYISRLESSDGRVADLCFDVGDSAWGLSLHKNRRLLAVSANTKIVSVYELGIAGISPNAPARGHDLPRQFRASEINLPSINFLQDEPSGRWLAATDIEGKIVVYDLLLDRVFCDYTQGLDQGWSVTFVSNDCFKWLDISECERFLETDSENAEGWRIVAQDEASDSDGPYETQWAASMQQSASNPEAVGLHDIRSEIIKNAAYGVLADHQSDRESAIDVLDTESRDLLWQRLQPYPPLSVILHATEHNIGLYDIRPRLTSTFSKLPQWSYMVPCQVHEHIIPVEDPSHHAHYLGLFPRLNMVHLIPSLSLYIAARQDGHVALVRLLRCENTRVLSRNPRFDQPMSTRFFIREHVLPDEKYPAPQNTPLAGIAVSPIQGWHPARQRRRPIGVSLGNEVAGAVGGRWRLVLLYANGVLLNYEIFAQGKKIRPCTVLP